MKPFNYDAIWKMQKEKDSKEKEKNAEEKKIKRKEFAKRQKPETDERKSIQADFTFTANSVQPIQPNVLILISCT